MHSGLGTQLAGRTGVNTSKSIDITSLSAYGQAGLDARCSPIASGSESFTNQSLCFHFKSR